MSKKPTRGDGAKKTAQLTLKEKRAQKREKLEEGLVKPRKR